MPETASQIVAEPGRRSALSPLGPSLSTLPDLLRAHSKPHGFLFQMPENGTYPDADRILRHDNAQLQVLDPQPCEVCRTITLSALTRKRAPYGFKHHSSQRTLLDSADQGCRLCLWVCHALFLEPGLEGHPDKEGTRAPKGHFKEHQYQYPPILRYSQSLGGIEILNPFEETGRNILRVYTDYLDPAASFIHSRRVYNISTVESTIRRFGRLLNSREVETKVLPKRVIDVGETNDILVKVRDFGNNPPLAHYICLSHHWQRSCPSITNQSNFENRKLGVALDDLSATLRDAIHLTRAFNIRYLWIDSLCILQDSKNDWEVESSKMGSYYGRSWLTLAAGLDNEPDVNCGGYHQASSILGPRYKPNTGAGYYHLPITKSDSGSKMYFNLQDELKWDNRGSSYLYSRGWTLQEEAFSPRFLSFQPRQSSLRIKDKIYHESGFVQQIGETSFINTDGTDHASWAGIVEDYSQRHLTKEGDKLPALSGIAQLYQRKYKDKYLAGLWFSCLLENLCWCVPISTTGTRRPVNYRAPTWSWASLEGKVVFDHSQIQPRQIKILEATTTPAGQDPLGTVRDGSIRLEAQLSKQHWKRDSALKGKWYYASPRHAHFSPPDELGVVAAPFSNATLRLDVENPTIDELELFSLPIHDQFALALQAVDSRDSTLEKLLQAVDSRDNTWETGDCWGHIFRRIGAICWRSKKDDVGSSEPAIITII